MKLASDPRSHESSFELPSGEAFARGVATFGVVFESALQIVLRSVAARASARA